MLYFKKKGERWLEKLPHLIEYCEQKWKLKMKEPYALSVNYVAPAILENGREVVVKICIPGKEYLNELEALQLLKNNGMVQLVDFDKDNGILILERLSPGFTLAEVAEDDEACNIAANVLKKLHKEPPPNTQLPTTRDREASLQRIIIEHQNGIGPILISTLEKALKVFTYLNQTMKQQWLLHGDFHHYNVLSSGVGRWTAIDPKGLIGEVEYDLIQYMLNVLPDNEAYSVIERRVRIFTDELKVDLKRLLLWGYFHSVLATSWSVDEHQNYDPKFYQCIAIFEKLFECNFDVKLEMFNSTNT
jgi:streptomycin 6-kinase